MRNQRFSALIALGYLVLACACSPKPAATAKPEPKRYRLEGNVVAIDKSRHEVTIDHKQIPGFMDAMTMPYTLPDEAVLGGLTVGDSITAALVVADDKSWLEEVRVIKRGTQPPRGGG